jgi:succinate dehydrogenase hydrophobic anchor subunit
VRGGFSVRRAHDNHRRFRCFLRKRHFMQRPTGVVVVTEVTGFLFLFFSVLSIGYSLFFAKRARVDRDRGGGDLGAMGNQ